MKCSQIQINKGTHISLKCIALFSTLTTDRHIRSDFWFWSQRPTEVKKKCQRCFLGSSQSESFFPDERWFLSMDSKTLEIYCEVQRKQNWRKNTQGFFQDKAFHVINSSTFCDFSLIFLSCQCHSIPTLSLLHLTLVYSHECRSHLSKSSSKVPSPAPNKCKEELDSRTLKQIKNSCIFEHSDKQMENAVQGLCLA